LGHPRVTAASRTPRQRSRVALVSGHPQVKPASRTSLR
jgi:hypothetical protein